MGIPVLFDMDGVIVNNLAFEREVTSIIVHGLAEKHSLNLIESAKLWRQTLELHQNHPRWHDYSYHCENLDLGELWKDAHQAAAPLLQKCPSSEDALRVAAEIGQCWLASDATRWVVDFKLRVLGLPSTSFLEIFCVDRCESNKGQQLYWQRVRASLPNFNCSIVYIDNRLDRLETAQCVITNCTAIWVVDSPDHPVLNGFGPYANPSNTAQCLLSTHEELPAVLATIARNPRT